jgi:hypothetical protein
MDTGKYFIGGSTENSILFLSNALFFYAKFKKIKKVYVINGNIGEMKIAIDTYNKSNVNLIMCNDYQYTIFD